MENKGKESAEKKGKKVDELKAEEVERRNAPVTLDADGDGLITGRLKPRDRVL